MTQVLWEPFPRCQSWYDAPADAIHIGTLKGAVVDPPLWVVFAHEMGHAKSGHGHSWLTNANRINAEYTAWGWAIDKYGSDPYLRQTLIYGEEQCIKTYEYFPPKELP